MLIQINNILNNLEISQDTSVILGGDFNLFLEKSLNTDGGIPPVKTKFLSKLQEIMTENDLCDIFLNTQHTGTAFHMEKQKSFQITRIRLLSHF